MTHQSIVNKILEITIATIFAVICIYLIESFTFALLGHPEWMYSNIPLTDAPVSGSIAVILGVAGTGITAIKTNMLKL